MQYSFAAVLALAATVIAHSNDTVVYTTVVVEDLVTVCPPSATITVGSHTITNTLTETSTATIIGCSCTVVKPILTTSTVAVPTVVPVYPNGTIPVPTTVGSTTPPAATSPPVNLPASGANKLAMSGASLAGLLGLAAYLL